MMAMSVRNQLLSLLIVTGCGRVGFGVVADAAESDVGDAQADSDGPALGPFGQPMPISMINSTVDDDDPTLTGDQLELIFDSNRGAGAFGDLYVSRRATVDAPWSGPTVILELMTADDEDAPNLSLDGLTLTFASARATGAGSDDLYITSRATRTAPWMSPVQISELATPASESDLSTTADGRIGVFARAGVVYEVKRSTSAGMWDPPVPIGAIDPGGIQEDPMMTSDGLRLVYSGADGVGGDFALYLASRGSTSEPFGPGALITELETPTDETDPWLSLDGHTLLYTLGTASARDIYFATR